MRIKIKENTDRRMYALEKKLSGIYNRAAKDTGAEWKAYMASVEKRSQAYLDAIKAAKTRTEREVAEDAYRRFMENATLRNAHYQAMTNNFAREISRVNETAAAYINNELPEIYSINHNAAQKGIKGVLNGYSFEMVSPETIRNLAMSDKTLLPYKIIDGIKDVRWNTQKVNAEVLQGILKGESIPKMSKRLQNVVNMDKNSAIRNARTAVTCAQNEGRMAAFEDAKSKGVQLYKVWIATSDERTREAHADLDGVTIPTDEAFENEIGKIMFPADPDADPANVYNCRCTLGSEVKGFWNR